MELRNGAGAALNPPVATTGGNGSSASFMPTADGTYFVRVYGTEDWLYSLTVTTYASLPNTNGIIPDTSGLLGNDQCATPDAGNTSAAASQLATTPSDFSPVACYGFFGTPETDAEDWYKFDVSGTESGSRVLSFELDSDTVSVAYEIKIPSGAILVSSNGAGQSILPHQASLVPLAKNGTYKLRLFTPNGVAAGRYEFALDVRNGIGNVATPQIPPSLPPVEALNQDSCATPGKADASNAKNTASTLPTTSVSATGYCYGALGKTTGDNQDWYVFTATKTDKLSFLLSGDGLSDPNITLYRPNGTVFPGITSSPGAIPEYGVQVPLDANGLWAMKIAQGTTTAGNYVLTYDWRAEIVAVPSNLPTNLASAVPTIPSIGLNLLTDDCNGAGDAPNTKPKTIVIKQPARPIRNQSACTGSLGMTSASDAQDWYSFTVKAGQMLLVGVSGDGALDPSLYLYTQKGVRIPSFPNASPIPDYIRYDVQESGIYRIQVTRANNAAGHYGLFIDVPNEVGGVPFVSQSVPATPSISGDCNGAGDAPSTKPKTTFVAQPARDYSPNNACMAALGGADRDDWYQFGASVGQHFSMGLTMDYGLDVILYLVDPRGVIRVISANGGLTPESIQNYVIDRTGTWKLKVQLAEGAGKYYMASELANT